MDVKPGLDPELLDHATKQRLEAILERTDGMLTRGRYARLYHALGNVEMAREQTERLVEQYLHSDLLHISFEIKHYLESEKVLLSETQRKTLLEEGYGLAREKKSYEEALWFARQLDFPTRVVEDLEEMVAYDTMTNPGYFNGVDLTMVEERCRSLPPERVRIAAELAYDTFLRDDKLDAALFLACHYKLGSEKIGFVKNKILDTPEYIAYGAVISLLEQERALSQEEAQRLKIRWVSDLMERGDLEGYLSLIQEYSFQGQEEIRNKLNKHYHHYMKQGLFAQALEIRKKNPEMVEDSIVSVADLETLVGVISFINPLRELLVPVSAIEKSWPSVR